MGQDDVVPKRDLRCGPGVATVGRSPTMLLSLSLFSSRLNRPSSCSSSSSCFGANAVVCSTSLAYGLGEKEEEEEKEAVREAKQPVTEVQ